MLLHWTQNPSPALHFVLVARLTSFPAHNLAPDTGRAPPLLPAEKSSWAGTALGASHSREIGAPGWPFAASLPFHNCLAAA
jgi:hypothetical protein